LNYRAKVEAKMVSLAVLGPWTTCWRSFLQLAASPRLHQIFQSRRDLCLGGTSRNPSPDEPVYNFVNSDKEPPLLFCGDEWLKSTGNNLCPSSLFTPFCFDGEMLLWMRFFTVGELKKKKKKKPGSCVAQFIARRVCFLFSFRPT
jgi:hypothetical protein